MIDTLTPGTLVVASAFPDPPFELMQDGVAMQEPTHEKLGIAFAKNNTVLCDAVESALQALRSNGEFARLQSHWFPGS